MHVSPISRPTYAYTHAYYIKRNSPAASMVIAHQPVVKIPTNTFPDEEGHSVGHIAEAVFGIPNYDTKETTAIRQGTAYDNTEEYKNAMYTNLRPQNTAPHVEQTNPLPLFCPNTPGKFCSYHIAHAT